MGGRLAPAVAVDVWLVGPIIYGTLALAAATFFLARGGDRRVTNPLAWFLVVEGASFAGLAQVIWNLAPSSPAVQHAAATVIGFGFLASPWLYLLFVGEALDTPVARPLRRRIAKILLLGAMVVNLAVYLVDPSTVSDGLVWVLLGMGLPFVGALVWGLLAAVERLRHAAQGTARRQAKAYFFAFLARDLSFIFGFVLVSLSGTIGVLGQEPVSSIVISVFYGGPVLFVILLVYGALTGQILELDRRFRFGITQTTAVAIVATLFFVIIESVEQLFAFNNPVFSVAIAGALFLVFRPVQKVSERLAARLLPAGTSISDMDPDERVQVYREQVALAWKDGAVTSAEEEMLKRFRVQLGLTTRQAKSAARATLEP